MWFVFLFACGGTDPAVRLDALDRCGMDPDRTPAEPVSAVRNGETDLWWVGLVDVLSLGEVSGQGRVEELELMACRGNGLGVEQLLLWGGLDLDRVWVDSFAGRYTDQQTGALVLLGPGDFWVDVDAYEGNRTPEDPEGSLDATVTVDDGSFTFEAELDLTWGLGS